MVDAAPRLSRRLVLELERLADRGVSAAEITRRLGVRAAGNGLAQPSYETVRRLVRARRRLRRQPSTTDVVLDVVFRSRPPTALLDHVSGVGVPTRRL